MLIGAIVGVCILLALLAFLAPRLSSKPQRGVNKALGSGQRAGGKAPGIFGRLLQKPFSKSAKAANRSASAGRRGRSKLPL